MQYGIFYIIIICFAHDSGLKPILNKEGRKCTFNDTLSTLYFKQLWHSHEVDMMFYGAKKTHIDRGRRPRLIFVLCAP